MVNTTAPEQIAQGIIPQVVGERTTRETVPSHHPHLQFNGWLITIHSTMKNKEGQLRNVENLAEYQVVHQILSHRVVFLDVEVRARADKHRYPQAEILADPSLLP